MYHEIQDINSFFEISLSSKDYSPHYAHVGDTISIIFALHRYGGNKKDYAKLYIEVEFQNQIYEKTDIVLLGGDSLEISVPVVVNNRVVVNGGTVPQGNGDIVATIKVYTADKSVLLKQDSVKVSVS